MKQITDKSGRVIAFENDVNPNRKEIRDRGNSLLGFYNPTTDKTYDKGGKVISNAGDSRAFLIKK